MFIKNFYFYIDLLLRLRYNKKSVSGIISLGDIKMSFLSRISKQYYQECVADLLNDPVVLQMDQYIQHSEVSCLEHSLFVSYLSFAACRLLNLNYYAAARGALLHDLFLYDWHTPERRGKLHGFTHPTTALNNAKKYFNVSPIEQDIIKKHMWPLTFFFPSFAESLIVSCADKVSAIVEVFGLYKMMIIRRIMKLSGMQ